MREGTVDLPFDDVERTRSIFDNVQTDCDCPPHRAKPRAVDGSGIPAGGQPSILMVGPHNKTVVSGFAGIAAQRYQAPSDSPTTIVGTADVYMSDFGTLNVVCNRELPNPSISWNCLGNDCLLTGQNLDPTPPAMITAYLLFINSYLFFHN